MPVPDLRDSIPPDDFRPIPSVGKRVWPGRAASVGLYFVQVVGMGGVGLIVGLLSGAWRASRQVAAIPPRPITGPGFAPAPGGLEEMGIWFGCLVVGGVGGLVIGLAIGLIGMPILALVRPGARRRLAEE